jgi:hypothetical protein
MATKIVTIHNKHHVASQFIESVSETTNTAYYVFVGDQYDRSELRNISNSDRDIIFDTYQNMIMGKRVTPNDVKLAIRNIPYVSNTKYDMYDDTDQLLYTKDYYAIVNASSYYHVYKCLDNNGNSYSTVVPDISHISGANTDLYETSDGYRWKYMYSVSSSDKTKFANQDYFPIVANSSVTNSAVTGSLSIIKIIDPGKRYDNYTEGTFISSQIRVNGNSTLYEISNTSLKTSNGFYTNCLIYISSGTGVGQYKKITDYFSNANGNYIGIESAFIISPTNGSEYEIYPNIKIVGSGNETINAVARALINSASSNSIYKIETLDQGAGYTYHIATVEANSIVKASNGFVEANVRPIYSPPGGHGYSIENELYSTSAIISVEFANSESNTILTTNKFNQVGLLKDPMFNNVKLNLNSIVGSFTSNEKILKIKPVRINTNAVSNSSTANIVCSAADFENQLVTGDKLIMAKSDFTDYFLVTVNSIVNSSHITLTSNSNFTSNNIWLYLPNITSNAYINDIIQSNTFLLSNTQGIFSTGDIIIGEQSGAYANISSIIISDTPKGFNTFIQLDKFTGNVISGTFTENEVIYQTNTSTATGTLHSAINIASNGVILYVSNATGNFQFGNVGDVSYTVIGSSSNTIAYVSNSYSGELVFGSGEILYINNIEAIERSNTQKETFKIIFEF